MARSKKGGVVDLICADKRIIAEVKNKHNTTKGNHKVRIYDDFGMLINDKYAGYTAYYVEIIPLSKKRYNTTFAPSDNQTKKRRPENPKILKIDGYSFYSMVTGESNALELVYLGTAKAIAKILGTPVKENTEILELFNRTY